jgi:uncharacterized membrane protein
MQHTRRVLTGSLLTAATVAMGFALAGVPNVELMTLMVFVTGFLLGARGGAVVGAVSIGLHSVLNPFGAAMPPLLAAQIGAFAVIGACGGWIAPRIASGSRLAAAVLAGVSGALLTLFYDALTNVAVFFTITGEHAPASIVQFVVGGLTFAIMHVVWNTAIFAATLRPILAVLSRYRDELAGGM